MDGWWQRRLWCGPLVTLLIWVMAFPPTIFRPQLAEARYVAAPAEQFPQDHETSSAFATGDVDGDGDVDVIVANTGQSQLWLGDGQSTFSDVTGTQLPALTLTTRAAVLGDVDGDTDLDLILGDVHGPNRLLFNDGSGQFTLAPESHLPAQSQVSMGLALGDGDRDGDLDLVVANRRSQNRLWLNDGSGVFSDTTNGHLPVDAADSYDVTLGDVDGNGTLDLVVANHRAPDQLLMNNGLGVFTDVTDAQFSGATSDSFDVELADIDSDGDLDALIAAGSTPLRLWTNDGSGIFSEVTDTQLPAFIAFGFRVDPGDVDADGDVDVVLGAAGQDRVFLNDGSGQFTDDTDTLLPTDIQRSVDLALRDADRDLDLDLLVATPGGANRFLLNVLSNPRLRITATPAAPREVNNPVTLTIEATDEEGIVNRALTLTDPNGQDQNIPLLPDLASGLVVHTFTPILTGDYEATVTVADSLGNPSTRQLIITVLAPDTTPPQVAVTVQTPAPILVGQAVSLQVNASDDRGVVQTTLTVNGASVPVASNGSATFVPTVSGLHSVVAQASDAAGNSGQDTTAFTVDADTTPPTVTVNATPNPVNLTEPVSITVTTTDDVAVLTRTLRVSGPVIPDGIDLTLDAAGQATFTPFQPGTYTLEASATDPSGNTGMATASFDTSGTPDTTPPTVQVQVTPNPVGVGTPVTATVTVTDDSAIASTTLIINDIPIPLDTSGRGVYTPPTLGTFTAVAVARDVFGNTNQVQTTFEAVDPAGDTESPVVNILSPEPGSELSTPTDIMGTVEDQTLVEGRIF